MDLKGKKVWFLGDSITQGVGASTLEANYVSVFARLTGAEIRNYGIGGTRIGREIGSVNEIWDQNFMDRVPLMEEGADVVVVFGGTNDFGHGDYPFGEITDETDATFCGAVNTLIRLLKEKYPTSRIVFVTPIHRLSEADPINEIGLPRRLLVDYVVAISKIVANAGLEVLDLFNNFELKCDTLDFCKQLTCDTLHPNDKGYEFLAEAIKEFLTTGKTLNWPLKR